MSTPSDDPGTPNGGGLHITREGGALRLALDRPDVLNALSLELLGALREALEAAAGDPTVRAVLLTGRGRAFCAGADLASIPLDGEGGDVGDVGEVVERAYNPVARLLAGMEKPVVAGVNGVAAGAGLSLALACDLRLVSRAASFTVGFTGIGLAMDASASFFLPRLVGRGRAFELAYGNRRVPAEEAVALGLGEVLLDAEGFEEEAWARARRLARGPTLAYGLVKRQLNAAASGDLEDQLALEVRLQRRAGASDDAREGVRAFRERRAPDFRGR